MYVGTLAIDVLLGDVRSLKQKRSAVRPIVAELRRKYAVAAAEVDHVDLYRRTVIGVATVASTMAQCIEVLDACERMVAAHPEIELLSVVRQLHSREDE